MNIQEAIRTVVANTGLSIEQARDVFDQIMSGGATDAQIAALIIALRMKGETPDEITGAATVMREKATAVLPATHDHLLDTCGTGGDGSNTFNISTATAFVAAGAGAVVAKHGNRGVSSKSGSADVLEALGVNIGASAECMKRCLDEIGIAFLFAPSLHKAMKYAIGPRKEIGVRTIFNVLGPLTNPARAKRQLMGVFSPDLTGTMAMVLNNLGTERAFVVHGMEGLDEVSIGGPTRIAEVRDGTVTTYTITPDMFAITPSPLASIAGGTPQENAEIIRGVFAGATGPHRDVVVLNAAFAVTAAGLCENVAQGVELAKRSIDSGAARRKLDALAAMTANVG